MDQNRTCAEFNLDGKRESFKCFASFLNRAKPDRPQIDYG